MKNLAFISHDFEYQGAQGVLLRTALLLRDKYNIMVLGFRSGPLQSEYKARGISTAIISDSQPQSYFQQFDCVIMNTLVMYPLFSNFDNEFLREKCILWIHESERDVYQKIFKFNREKFRSLRHIIFVSRATQQMYRDLMRENGSSVVMYPMNVKAPGAAAAAVQKLALRKANNIPVGATLITTVGVVAKRKGQDDLLRSVIPILATNRSVYVAIVGFSGVDKEFENQIGWMVKNSGYSDRILLVPQMRDVKDWYVMSDIFASCSYIESLPAVIFEAMLYRLSVVAFSVYGVPEQIEDGRTGLLVAAGDTSAFRASLESVISNKKAAIEMGNRSREATLKRLSTTTFVENITRIIEEKTERGFVDYFAGKTGLEIGGPSGAFQSLVPIYQIAKKIDGVNYSETTIWDSRLRGSGNYTYFADKKGDQYIYEATNLTEIADNTYDFILSSHSLEHIANPLKALKEWTRVVKFGGTMVVIVPNKNVCFDHKRDYTSLEHIMSDYRRDMDEGDLTHLDEILSKHDLSMDLPAGTIDQFRERSMKNHSNRTLHHHVFSEKLMHELFDVAGISLKKSYVEGLNIVCIGTVHKDAVRPVKETPTTDEANFVGSGDFKIIGEEFLKYFIEIGGLKPSDSVLDIGCGIGRMALPLTRYLSKVGSYIGFDIVESGVNWCTKNISSKFANFQFFLADVHNSYSLYNPNGQYKAAKYKFPFKNHTFDFIFLTSVFTHMLPSDVENYIAEISRVLRPDGRVFLTIFVLNQESLDNIGQNKGTFSFKYDHGHCRFEDESQPEFAVAYKEDFIRGILKRHGLKIVEPIHFGSWCGRAKHVSFQDILLVTKDSLYPLQ